MVLDVVGLCKSVSTVIFLFSKVDTRYQTCKPTSKDSPLIAVCIFFEENGVFLPAKRDGPQLTGPIRVIPLVVERWLRSFVRDTAHHSTTKNNDDVPSFKAIAGPLVAH